MNISPMLFFESVDKHTGYYLYCGAFMAWNDYDRFPRMYALSCPWSPKAGEGFGPSMEWQAKAQEFLQRVRDATGFALDVQKFTDSAVNSAYDARIGAILACDWIPGSAVNWAFQVGDEPWENQEFGGTVTGEV